MKEVGIHLNREEDQVPVEEDIAAIAEESEEPPEAWNFLVYYRGEAVGRL